jgi:hypothetical protein
MRDHGVQMEDPEVGENGEMQVQIGAGPDSGEAPPDKAKVDAAMKECQKLMPGGGENRQPSAEDLEKLRKMSECMRANGVPNFPDPDANGGGLMINPDELGGKDAVDKAMEKCSQYMPKGPGASTTDSQGGSK